MLIGAGVTALLIFMMALSFLLPDEPAGKGEGKESLPAYLRLESEDTFLDAADINGLWVNVWSSNDQLVFSRDHTYISTGAYASGTYAQGEGYVKLETSYGTYAFLRLIKSGDGFRLQHDMDSMPITYAPGSEVLVKEEPGEEVNIGIREEEFQRFAVSTVQQILRKSRWISDEAEFNSIRFEDEVMRLSQGHTVVGEWLYHVNAAEIKADCYEADMTINGSPYTIRIIGKGDYGSEGYEAIITGADGQELLQIQSKEPIRLEQPK